MLTSKGFSSANYLAGATNSSRAEAEADASVSHGKILVAGGVQYNPAVKLYTFLNSTEAFDTTPGDRQLVGRSVVAGICLLAGYLPTHT